MIKITCRDSILENKKAFGVVEVLLAVSIASFLLTFVISTILVAQESLNISGKYNKANFFAEEGIEAIKNIKKEDFSLLVDGTHGIVNTSGTWELSGSSSSSSIYTRQISISTTDADTKDVTSTVTWQQSPQRTGSINLVTRLTNWEVASAGGDWSNPSVLGTQDIAGNSNANKVKVDGQYAYLNRSGSPDFYIMDISDYSSPSVSGTLVLNGSPRNLFVSGDYVYIASNSNSQELQVIDVSNKSSPSLEDSLNLGGSANANGIYVSGNTAYLVRTSSGQDEFYTIDVSNPSSVSELDSIGLSGGTASDVYVSGDYAYLATNSNSGELIVIDVSNPNNISQVGSLDLSSGSNAISVDGYGNYVFIGRRNGDFTAINVTIPASPVELGTYDADDDVNDISVDETSELAFIVTNGSTDNFRVLNISNPLLITLVSQQSISGDQNGVDYISGDDKGISVGEGNSQEVTIYEPN